MEINRIEYALNNFFAERLKSPKRYRGLVFMANSIPVLQEIKQKLSQILAPVEIWNHPNEGTAPTAPISRQEFCHTVFETKHPVGLLIYMPDEWMLNWPAVDKRIFWSQLAQTFGRNDVYVIYASTPANLRNHQQYFHRASISHPDLAILSSKYEQ